MIYLILPAYNEEKSLALLVPKIDAVLNRAKERYSFLICNDGSRDNTGKIIHELSRHFNIEVITHKINRGLGETSRDLFEKAAELSSDSDIIIRMDCDNTHEPDCIPQMISRIKEGYDVVIASRFRPSGGQKGLNLYKSGVSYCANLFMKLFFPIPGIREYSCGFRAYRAKYIKMAVEFFGNDFIQLKGLGFTCTLEKLVKLKMLGARFAEVPFVLRYDQKASSSKMVGSLTTFGYLTMALLYHWPWGGWRLGDREKIRVFLLERNKCAE